MEHERRRRLGTGYRNGHAHTVTDREHAACAEINLDLNRVGRSGPKQLTCSTRKSLAVSTNRCRVLGSGLVDNRRPPDLRRESRQLGQGGGGIHGLEPYFVAR